MRGSLIAGRPVDPDTVPRLVRLLTEFAIWFSHDWQEDNADDLAAAKQWVKHFLEGGERG